ncbi:unnamed protein product [Calypogeia fissa]
MATMKFQTLCRAALLLSLLAIMDFHQAKGCGSLVERCHQFNFGDDTRGTFTAICDDGNKTQTISIDLNQYNLNDDGELKAGGGGFANSCTRLTQYGFPQAMIVKGNCRKRDGTLLYRPLH